MKFSIALTVIAITCAGAASAQQATDLYVGGAFDYSDPSSGDEDVFGSVLAGFNFEVGSYGFGAEAEYGLQFSSGDDRDVARVRALISYDFSSVTGFASVGAVQYDIDGQNSEGETFGLGLQAPIANNLEGRVEVIRDLVDGDFDTNVTTARAAVLYQF